MGPVQLRPDTLAIRKGIAAPHELLPHEPKAMVRPEQRNKHQDASRKGKAVEHLVAASCILASAGELQ